MLGVQDGRQTESLARTYERPALRKAFAALLADTKVACASLAVMATVVSTSAKLPPPAAASTAEAAAFSSGNSPMTRKSWWPKVKYHPMSLPPTLLKSFATASSRFSGLASMPLMASEVKRPGGMYIGMASLLQRVLLTQMLWTLNITAAASAGSRDHHRESERAASHLSRLSLVYGMRRRPDCFSLRFLPGEAAILAGDAGTTAFNANCLARFAILSPTLNLSRLC